MDYAIANQIAQRPSHQQRGRFFALPEADYLDLIQSGRTHIDIRRPQEQVGEEHVRTSRIIALAQQKYDSNSF